MKSALCMYGKIGGSRGKDGYGDVIDFRECFDSINEHIIKVNNCDVFMHCWNFDLKDELVSLYRPKKHVIQPQIIFKTKSKPYRDKRDEFIGQSRWYSHKTVLELKRQYEKEKKIKYNWVMVCRYDVLFYVDVNFNELEKGYFYASHFNDGLNKRTGPNKENHTLKTKRLLDIWFIGPTRFMDRFANIYDHFYDHVITDPHKTAWDFINRFSGDPIRVIRFKYYRHYDYELWRIVHGVRK